MCPKCEEGEFVDLAMHEGGGWLTFYVTCDACGAQFYTDVQIEHLEEADGD